MKYRLPQESVANHLQQEDRTPAWCDIARYCKCIQCVFIAQRPYPPTTTPAPQCVGVWPSGCMVCSWVVGQIQTKPSPDTTGTHTNDPMHNYKSPCWCSQHMSCAPHGRPNDCGSQEPCLPRSSRPGIDRDVPTQSLWVPERVLKNPGAEPTSAANDTTLQRCPLNGCAG